MHPHKQSAGNNLKVSVSGNRAVNEAVDFYLRSRLSAVAQPPLQAEQTTMKCARDI